MNGKTGIVTLIITIFFFSACSSSDKDKNNFIETYKEILVIREMYQDSVKANTAVKTIIKKNGYSDQSFYEEWKKYTANPSEFNTMMDTIRQRAQAELIRQNKRKIKE